jgi:hypothetical protein
VGYPQALLTNLLPLLLLLLLARSTSSISSPFLLLLLLLLLHRFEEAPNAGSVLLLALTFGRFCNTSSCTAVALAGLNPSSTTLSTTATIARISVTGSGGSSIISSRLSQEHLKDADCYMLALLLRPYSLAEDRQRKAAQQQQHSSQRCLPFPSDYNRHSKRLPDRNSRMTSHFSHVWAPDKVQTTCK